MLRKIIFSVLCACAIGPSFAQITTEKDRSESSEGHWFVSVAAGPQVYFSDHDKQMKFGDRISPALDISVGRWFNHWAGLRLMYSGVSLKGATQNGAHSNGKPIEGKPWNGYWLTEQKFNMYNIHADALFNITNLIWGENGDRIYDCSPYAGIGFIGTGDEPSQVNFSGDFGILNTFRVHPNWALNLDLRGTLTGDSFDGEKGGRSEGILGLTVGVTYTFK